MRVLIENKINRGAIQRDQLRSYYEAAVAAEPPERIAAIYLAPASMGVAELDAVERSPARLGRPRDVVRGLSWERVAEIIEGLPVHEGDWFARSGMRAITSAIARDRVAPDRSAFLSLWSQAQPSTVTAANAVLDWVDQQGLESWFGDGRAHGTLNVHLPSPKGSARVLMLTTEGNCGLWVIYQDLATVPPFDQPARRTALGSRLLDTLGSARPLGTALALDPPAKPVLYSLAAAADPSVADLLIGVLEWFIQEARGSAAEQI